jgi:signal transduction histidine kinase
MHNIAFGIIISLIFISLIVIFCGILIKVYVEKNKKYTNELYQKDIHFQKTMTKIVMETQEQTLQNVSHELHDDAGQQLTFINFQLENLKLDNPDYSEKLEPISDSVSKLSKSIRSLSHSLNNISLTKDDFIIFLQNEIQNIRKNIKVNIELKIEENEKKIFTNEEKIFLYRIFQEVINNSLKHSKAKEIVVHLITNPKFEMQISDNGKGFDIEENKNISSMGLNSIVSRAEMIGYSAKIISKNGSGTKIIIKEKEN